MHFFNQLEPDSLIKLFINYPPENFVVSETETGLPTFVTRFDLMTTMDFKTQQNLKKKPFYALWSKWFNIQTEFIGSTVSEYLLLKNYRDPAALAQTIIYHYNEEYPLLIVKDIPVQSPFLTQSQNDYSKALAEELVQNHFIEVEGQALAYVPIDFDSVDEFLDRFSKSRRKNYRRKLRSRALLTIKELTCGDPQFFDEAVLAHYYQLYLNVYEQSEIHFDKLSFDFFKALLQQKEPTCKIITYEKEAQLIGYNICYLIDDRLVDKYIGLDYELTKNTNLYFVSWFYNLELAKKLNLSVYIAGWTDPEIKRKLGAQFTFTNHYVYVRNGLIKRLLTYFKAAFETDSAFKTMILEKQAAHDQVKQNQSEQNQNS